MTQAFLRHAAKDAVLIALTAGLAHLPSMPGYSSYSTSKLAGIKLFESVQAENPELRVVNVHPGVIKSEMSDKGAAQGATLSFDDGTPIPFRPFVTWRLRCMPANDSTISFPTRQLHSVGF